MTVSIGHVRIPASIPPQHPDITIHIQVRDGRLWLVFFAWSQQVYGDVALPVSLPQFRTIGSRLVTALEDLILFEYSKVQLNNLVIEGASAYSKLFREDSLRSLRELLKSRDKAIYITSPEDFAFPWDLLALPGGTRSAWRLLGLRHKISYLPHVIGGESNMVLKVTKTPTTGLLLDSGYSGVRDRESRFFNALARLGVLNNFSPDPITGELDNNQRHKHIFAFLLSKRFDILHFAGHSDAAVGKGKMPIMRVLRDVQIDFRIVREFFLDNQLRSNPLVFLNGCGTGAFDPESSLNLARHFLTYGAGGVLATLCKIRDNSAATFARRFYRLAARGKTLGDCTLAVRRKLWTGHKDLTGLAYALYCQNTCRIFDGKCSSGQNGESENDSQ